MRRLQHLFACLLLFAAACGGTEAPAPPQVELVADLPRDEAGILQADFGHVGHRATAPLGLSLRNHTDRRQEVRIAIEGAAFTGPARLALEPHQTLPFSLLMRPQAVGPAEGVAAIVLPDGIERLDLRGQAVARCLDATDGVVFDETHEGCIGSRRRIEISNVCDHGVRLMSAEPDRKDFLVVGLPILPAPIEPGQTVTVALGILPARAGVVEGTLHIEDDAGAPLLVELAGVGLQGEWTVEEHVQGQRPDADRLYVVDDTPAMAPWADRLLDWAYAVEADLEDLDVQAAVTTSSRVPTQDCSGSGANGRLMPPDRSDRRVLDRLDLLDGALARRLTMDFCSEAPNEIFAAAERAVLLTDRRDDPATELPNDGNFGLRRTHMPLQVVLVTAADDESPGDLDHWYARLRSIRQRFGVRFVALVAGGDCEAPTVPERIGHVFGALREPVLHLCDEPQGGPWLQVQRALPLRATFPLSAAPADRNDDIRITEVDDDFFVTVGGVQIPEHGDDGERHWEVLLGPGLVRFAPGHVPEEGQRVTFEYLPACAL